MVEDDKTEEQKEEKENAEDIHLVSHGKLKYENVKIDR